MSFRGIGLEAQSCAALASARLCVMVSIRRGEILLHGIAISMGKNVTFASKSSYLLQMQVVSDWWNVTSRSV